MNDTYPPDFDFSRLELRAEIDFITLAVYKFPAPDAYRAGSRTIWIPAEEEDGVALLTVHDPRPDGLAALARCYPNALVSEIEIAIDLWPVSGLRLDERAALLETTMLALAGRLRPEEACPYGFGLRGATRKRNDPPQPFHDRLPPPGAQLLWGARGEWTQVKAYLKRTDQRKALPVEEIRPRVEVALRRGALMDLEVNCVQDVLDYGWRSFLTPYLRMIARPEVRKRADIPRPSSLEARAWRAWRRGGAGGFKLARKPAEVGGMAWEAMKYRESRQVSLRSVRLVRHRRANELVGNALRQLERRLRSARFSGGSGRPGSAVSQR